MGRKTQKAATGHTRKSTEPFVRYTVYNNRTDELVVLDGTAKECAQRLGIGVNTFYGYISRIKNTGKPKKWTILRDYTDGMPDFREEGREE